MSMLEVLKFVFSSFWVWAGTCILVICVVFGLAVTLGFLIGLSRVRFYPQEDFSFRSRLKDSERSALSKSSN